MEHEGTVVTEDILLPGFLRVQEPQKQAYYRSPYPRAVLNSKRKVEKYLEKQHKLGKLLGVDSKMFTFARKREPEERQRESNESQREPKESQREQSRDEGGKEGREGLGFWVKQLTPDPENRVDHQAELCRTATKLHESLVIDEDSDVTMSPGDLELRMERFRLLRKKLTESADPQSMMSVLYEDKEMNKLMCQLTQHICFTEISKLDTTKGPLGEFPPAISANWYCKMIEFAMEKLPVTLEHHFGFVVKAGHTVRPSHVIKLATLIANLCYSTNRDLDAIIKLRSVNLQLDSLTNEGLDLLSCQELSHTARALSNLKDKFSAVGPMLAKALASTNPSQSCLDNCDFSNEHLTVEFVMYESFDTKHLSTKSMEKAETLQLFTMDTILLSNAVNQKEKDHLVRDVLAVGVSQLIAKERPEAKKLSKYLPKRIRHKNSDVKPTPAQVVIQKPYPLQETKNSHTVRLLIRLQRKYLRDVASWMKDDSDFLKNLSLLEDCDAQVVVREAAEAEIKAVCLKYGEFISHGDLLTVAMFENAKLIMAGSVTAFGRLEFLGAMRLGIMHMKMKKVCIDYASMMKSVVNFDDQGCLAYLAHVSGKTSISNNPKDIKKDDSSFEHHDQFFAHAATQALLNLFDNYVILKPDQLKTVADEESAVNFIVTMLESYGVLRGVIYDPEQEEVASKEGEDDLFKYYAELVMRFLPSLGLDLCEAEGDFEGLRALERLMVAYFLGSNLKSQNCKYADYTLFDLVVFLSGSPRTRQRMEDNIVINPSGTVGGGMFWDKWCEVVVRMIKECLRRQHGGLDDISMEKDIGGLSVMAALKHHSRLSLQKGKLGKEHSHDFVKEEPRMIIAEQVEKLDPFSRGRKEAVVFYDKPRGSPYTGLTKVMVLRFLERKMQEFALKH